jgi:hypothetical protein
MSIKKQNKEREVRLYSKDIIDDMRESLCKAEVDGVLSEKNKLVHNLLWEGCHGWKNLHDAIIITQYEEVFGEYKK